MWRLLAFGLVAVIVAGVHAQATGPAAGTPRGTAARAVVTPAPAVVTPAPAVVTPAPAVVTPAPAVVTPAPAVVTPAPAVVTPAPAVVTPVQTSAPLPSTLTLTVNGLSCKATAAPCYRPGIDGDGLDVAGDSSVSIRAEADRPMPRGWKLQVYRTGDPLSKRNGDYYLVCETRTENSCERTRPGLPKGTNGDLVFAGVSAETGDPRIYAQITIKWK